MPDLYYCVVIAEASDITSCIIASSGWIPTWSLSLLYGPGKGLPLVGLGKVRFYL